MDEFSPFLARFHHQVEDRLDVEAMKDGARRFVGTHDFSAFTRSPARVEDPRRTMLESRLDQDGDQVTFDITGTGFLYNMVRNMVKALILIGRHDMAPDEIEELYRNQDRSRLGAPAPPGGLYLMRVMY